MPVADGSTSAAQSPTAAAAASGDQEGGSAGAGAAASGADSGNSTAERLQAFRAAVADALRPKCLWERFLATTAEVAAMLGQLISPALRRTTLLLLFIWFANAISYYGLVLLATTVRIFGFPRRCACGLQRRMLPMLRTF